jgi:eukaryotic-like serine/threonine-protein kinase
MAGFGRYTLVRKLAVGGMAEVFLARADGPMGFQKRCVVKRILPHFSDDPSFVQMFLGEARLAAELNHPNLVQVFDFGEVDGQYYIAMEYIDGPNLRVLNREARLRHGPIDLALAARIISMAAEGLHFAHELTDENGHLLNLVHRDISPDNILVSRSGAVKVVDFGIAKAANQPHLTKSGTVKGKLAYMPPEQLAREPLDCRADLFALGVVLFELVTGEMPFDATSEVSIIQAILGGEPLRRLRSRRTDAPDVLDEIIARCLSKAPKDRYANGRELRDELERFIQLAGTALSAGDIAGLVQACVEPEADFRTPSRPPGDGSPLEPTVSRSKGPVPTRPDSGGTSSEATLPPPRRTEPRPVDPSAAETVRNGSPARRPRSWRVSAGPLIGLVVLAGAAGAAAFWLSSRGSTPTSASAANVTRPAGGGQGTVERVVAVGAGSKPLGATGSTADPIEHAPAGAGAKLVTVAGSSEQGGLESFDAGSELGAVAAAGGETRSQGSVVAPRTGRLELRIRPYATVSIDGREIGDTPLPAQTLSVGRHRVRLLNPRLDKDVVLEVLIKPGENLLKHNLKE